MTTEQTADVEFLAVDRGRWSDFEALFEARGSPHYCWCMAWRSASKETRSATGPARKAMLKQEMHQRVQNAVPIGILGYRNGEPVAWCSVAPRASHRKLGGIADEDDGVWSITCFFVKRALRGQKLTPRLLEAAINHARVQGARVIEAYPVEADSPSYQFMGLIGMFERAGFERVGTAGKWRQVVRLAMDG